MEETLVIRSMCRGHPSVKHIWWRGGGSEKMLSTPVAMWHNKEYQRKVFLLLLCNYRYHYKSK